MIKLKTDDDTPYNILVDSGTAISYSVHNEKIIDKFLEENILDLIIITHSDEDHIKGFSRLFNKLLKCPTKRSRIKKVIYNSPHEIAKHLQRPTYPLVKKTRDLSTDTSAASAKEIQELLFDLELLEDKVVLNDGNGDIQENGISITYLAPTESTLEAFHDQYLRDMQKRVDKDAETRGKRESDYDSEIETLMLNTEIHKLSAYNRVSIAAIIKENSTESALIMLGDGDYEIVCDKLISMGFTRDNKLMANYTKLSHHGSVGNLSNEFLELVDCSNFLISTDGTRYNHPDKKTLARIWQYNRNSVFYFNYEGRIEELFRNEPLSPYKRQCIVQRSIYVP
ncbi:hypothetical protein [Paenibacillus sp. N3.4]|uniref:hypothetical protein n=1 Tax=Paenibacillus sp. N3.4 TaxID=2603222 RepID=UPI0011CA5C87|nr:hypothetical protein [Paenibacillus sp. N3.4]TXK79118.1 hypothetical protein FU659_20110 [Paenibacillus sp. N3.4]